MNKKELMIKKANLLIQISNFKDLVESELFYGASAYLEDFGKYLNELKGGLKE